MNDKQQAQWNQVVEIYAIILHQTVYESGGELHKWELCNQKHYLIKAVGILCCKDSAGNYLVEVADPEQNLPGWTQYHWGDMTNWKKLIPREG